MTGVESGPVSTLDLVYAAPTTVPPNFTHTYEKDRTNLIQPNQPVEEKDVVVSRDRVPSAAKATLAPTSSSGSSKGKGPSEASGSRYTAVPKLRPPASPQRRNHKLNRKERREQAFHVLREAHVFATSPFNQRATPASIPLRAARAGKSASSHVSPTKPRFKTDRQAKEANGNSQDDNKPRYDGTRKIVKDKASRAGITPTTDSVGADIGSQPMRQRPRTAPASRRPGTSEPRNRMSPSKPTKVGSTTKRNPAPTSSPSLGGDHGRAGLTRSRPSTADGRGRGGAKNSASPFRSLRGRRPATAPRQRPQSSTAASSNTRSPLTRKSKKDRKRLEWEMMREDFLARTYGLSRRPSTPVGSRAACVRLYQGTSSVAQRKPSEQSSGSPKKKSPSKAHQQYL